MACNCNRDVFPDVVARKTMPLKPIDIEGLPMTAQSEKILPLVIRIQCLETSTSKSKTDVVGETTIADETANDK